VRAASPAAPSVGAECREDAAGIERHDLGAVIAIDVERQRRALRAEVLVVDWRGQPGEG
jgi:hypothetical protein